MDVNDCIQQLSELISASPNSIEWHVDNITACSDFKKFVDLTKLIERNQLNFHYNPEQFPGNPSNHS